jgi:predicted RNase H-like HicB family nuclease
MRYDVVLHQEEGGGFWVEVPDLRGCYSQGATFEESLRNARQAILLHLDDVDEASRPTPLRPVLAAVDV